MWQHEGIINNQKVKIIEVAKDSPAEKLNLKVGDYIIRMNGSNVYQTGAVFFQVQKAKDDGKKIPATIESGGALRELELETYKEKNVINGEEVEVERIGITMAVEGEIRSEWYLAPYVAFKEMLRVSKMSIIGLADFLKTLFTTFKISEEVGGPVAIAQLTGTAAKMGGGALLQTIIILSIVLGIFNILPFPALDGGHILFVGVEKIIGREVPPSIKNIVNLAGFGLLLLLVASVTFKDIARLNIF
jgi:regulator of sigma E protease